MKNLHDDSDVQDNFLHNKNDKDSDSDDSDAEMPVKLFTKKSDKGSYATILLQELLSSQKQLSISTKKMYKKEAEIDGLEVKHRYTILELNNKELELTEMKEASKEMKKTLHDREMECMFARIMMMAFIILKILSCFTNFRATM